MIIFLWVSFSLAVGAWAHVRGRSLIGWALFSSLLSPLIGLIAVAVVGKSGLAAAPKDANGIPMTPDTHVHCPDCRALVRKEACKCMHCNAALIPQI